MLKVFLTSTIQAYSMLIITDGVYTALILMWDRHRVATDDFKYIIRCI